VNVISICLLLCTCDVAIGETDSLEAGMEVFSSPPKRSCNVPSPLLVNEDFTFSNNTTSDSDSGRGASPRYLSVSGYDRSPDIFGLAGGEEASKVSFVRRVPTESLQQANGSSTYTDSLQQTMFVNDKPLFGNGETAENPFAQSQSFRFSPLMDT
jgi:hypothetical protein